jgi:hypothetical protein
LKAEENGKNQVQRKAWQTVVLVVLYTNFICGTIALVVCVGTQTSPLLDGLTIESDKQQKSTGNQLHRRYLEPYSAWGRYMGKYFRAPLDDFF